MLRRAVLAALIVSTFVPTQAHARDYGLDWSRKKYGAIMPDAYYEQIAQCETGVKLGQPFKEGNPHSSYTSSMGIHKQTAFVWSGKRNLNYLTAKQLVRVADRIAFAGWHRPDGKYIWPVGPFGWAVVKLGCRDLLRYVCHARHPRVEKHKARACNLLTSRK